MAISSYGSGTKSSGVVRILKDLSTDISGVDVLVVEDIIDTGLTLSYLISNLMSRSPASLKVMAAFRKPEAQRVRGRRGLRRLRHPQRVRGRLRPGLQRPLPQPDLGRHAVARTCLLVTASRASSPSEGVSVPGPLDWRLNASLGADGDRHPPRQVMNFKRILRSTDRVDPPRPDRDRSADRLHPAGQRRLPGGAHLPGRRDHQRQRSVGRGHPDRPRPGDPGHREGREPAPSTRPSGSATRATS